MAGTSGLSTLSKDERGAGIPSYEMISMVHENDSGEIVDAWEQPLHSEWSQDQRHIHESQHHDVNENMFDKPNEHYFEEQAGMIDYSNNGSIQQEALAANRIMNTPHTKKPSTRKSLAWCWRSFRWLYTILVKLRMWTVMYKLYTPLIAKFPSSLNPSIVPIFQFLR